MGGSGGGGQSGAVDYPSYMKDRHNAWLTEIASYITNAQNNNPYDAGWGLPYSPTDELAAMEEALTDLEDYIDAMESDDGIAAEAAAYGAILLARIEADTIPAFEAGMRDINAVQTSTFVIGKGLLYAEKVRQQAQYLADLKGKYRLVEVDSRMRFTSTFIDAYRMILVANKEYTDDYIEYETAKVKWDLEMYQYGGNMLAAIGGAARSSAPGKPSRAQSAIGGAMAGAATGAMVGGGYGAIIGAVVGGVAGYFAA